MAVLMIDLGEVRTIPLDDDGMTIGREGGSDIVIPHPTVSRNHGRIDRVDGNYVLSDAASRNGTRVNGKAIEGHAPLPDGARLRIGHVRAWFFEQPPKRPPRPSVRKTDGIVFNCVCGARLWSASDTAGMTVACTACGQNIEIPSAPPPVTADLGGTVAGVTLDTAPDTDTRVACGVCQWPIEPGDEKHFCSSCNAPFHADCWTENKGCSTYGCRQVNALVPRVTARPAVPVIARGDDGAAEGSAGNGSAVVGGAVDTGQYPPPARPSTSWPHLLLGLSVLFSLFGLLGFGIPAAVIGLISLARLLVTRAGGRGVLAGAVAISILGAIAGYRVSGLWWWDRPLF